MKEESTSGHLCAGPGDGQSEPPVEEELACLRWPTKGFRACVSQHTSIRGWAQEAEVKDTGRGRENL